MLVKVGKTHKTFDTKGISTESVLILSEGIKKGTWMFMPSDSRDIPNIVFDDLEYATEVAEEFSGFVLYDAELEDYDVLYEVL
ncbi:hypothetical protein WRP3_091 [Lactococcus phage WRP3]|uniref:Uncharacterized protein n=1 Tax=Lactococcus phage WRP3 TaxID=1560313 RepID=A0A0D3MSV5_9CAUD|nr:hypothetical protein ACQ37_gp091 [Lactococcus phage WRP3]AIX12594.1 hypothetical protein WRP3_091 [Lactococcus phage WRP3]